MQEKSPRPNAPSSYQARVCWAALTCLAFTAIVATLTLFGWLVVKAISFLQPILIPIAIAAILAYLLEPVVSFLCRRKIKRLWAVVMVFAFFLMGIVGMIFYVAPSVHRQVVSFSEKWPVYSSRAQNLVTEAVSRAQKLQEFLLLQAGEKESHDPMVEYLHNGIVHGMTWVQNKIPDLAMGAGRFLSRSLGGFLGVFGFVISLVLVPIFLFFFLKEAPAIQKNWTKYLPLRAVPLGDEIVAVLTEINQYLVNFFRGQLLVSMIDGALTGIALLFVGVDFALLIGLMVGILGLIPYAGVLICWVPAVLITAAQFNDWWHPVLVTGIFLAVNNLDGIFISPYIVGESVGLHPMTIIISVIAWSMVLGGLLGALLAVPLTATLKVLFRRYFWERGVAGPMGSPDPPPASA